MQLALVGLGGLAVLAGLAFWLTGNLDYRVTDTHLQVTLFGACVRQVALSDIRGVSAHPLRRGRHGENWWNTFQPDHRILVIKRRTGLFRYFVITPAQRYVLRAELRAAIAQLRLENSAIQELEADENDPASWPPTTRPN